MIIRANGCHRGLNRHEILRFAQDDREGYWRGSTYSSSPRRVLLLEKRHHLFEGLVGDGFDFGLGAVLDGMGDVDDGGLEAQRIALRFDAFGEFRGDDVDPRQAAAIEIVEVVQTARCAGASIA